MLFLQRDAFEATEMLNSSQDGRPRAVLSKGSDESDYSSRDDISAEAKPLFIPRGRSWVFQLTHGGIYARTAAIKIGADCTR